MNVLNRLFPTVGHCCVCVQHQRRCGAIWRAGNSLYPGSYRGLLPE
nr:MAG TPA: hypothetical protein [Caudoviricetes sp.]